MAEGILQGKVAMITGAGSPIGLGHAMAVGLVRAGAQVALLDINDAWLQQSTAAIRSLGGEACAVPMVTDITNPDAVQQAVNRTLEELGGLHILVNNAGINQRSAGYTS
jgi:NAD(P)-dependent dehydrogenase (short-subunit alcohol dehydrogenase family)